MKLSTSQLLQSAALVSAATGENAYLFTFDTHAEPLQVTRTLSSSFGGALIDRRLNPDVSFAIPIRGALNADDQRQFEELDRLGGYRAPLLSELQQADDSRLLVIASGHYTCQ